MSYKKATMSDMEYIKKCTICGSTVVDTELHDAWHKSINLIATDLYGVDTELD